MPQLDFFTFPHQYLIASLCFCGMYYFNLLFFFARIKHLQLNKIFSLKGLLSNNVITAGDYNNITVQLLSEETNLFSIFFKKNRKLQRKFFLKKISSNVSISKSFTSVNLVVLTMVSFLLQFIFLKNFLSFNAEKLMLIYFLIIAISLFFFLKSFFKTLLQKDMRTFISIVCEIEEQGNNAIMLLKNFLVKLQVNTLTNQLEFLLLKNLEVKLIKKIKW